MNTPRRLFAARRPFLFLLLLIALGGCRDETAVSGAFLFKEIASVDGTPISLREAESRRARLFNGPSGQIIPETNEHLREQYLYVIRQIAEEMVISRFMEDKGAGLNEGELEAEEEIIRNDYPPGAFEQTLLEEGINLDLWRGQLRRMLLVRKYIAAEVRPQVMPTPEAIQDYYSKHDQEFIIPEQWHFFQIFGLDKTEAESARKAFLTNKNATEIQKRYMVTIREVRADGDTLPKNLAKELADLAPWTATPVKPYEQGFSSVVLLGKTPRTPLDAASVTARIEQILTEDTLAAVYEQKVDKLMSKAKVFIADALLRPDGEIPENAARPANASSGAKAE
ncbi:MAG: peptidyl-prolyl cis-trans isomerase [Deltaproteobacteria bacterium]|nr:peptidyl-prolyl cis-trans isomerase [Deltaproteobacteria bacterium]